MTLFRFACQSDVPQLKKLWAASFGDSEDSVQSFIYHFGYEIAIVSESEGKINGAAYLIPTGGLIFPDGLNSSCSYIYALAVNPDCRGQGLGIELSQAALRFSDKLGYEYSVLKPSSKSLFEFYRKVGFDDFSYINEMHIEKSELTITHSDYGIYSLLPADYTTLREDFLKGITHLKLSLRQAEYQSKLGKLLCIMIENHKCCAAVETYDNKVFVKELLLPDYNLINEALAIISSQFPAKEFTVKTPAYNYSSIVPSGMVYPPLEKNGIPYLGPAFD